MNDIFSVVYSAFILPLKNVGTYLSLVASNFLGEVSLANSYCNALNVRLADHLIC